MSITGGVLLDNEPMSPLDQLRQRWENINKDQNTKLRLSLNSLEHEQLSPVSAALFITVLYCYDVSLASGHYASEFLLNQSVCFRESVKNCTAACF